ncbi:MAG: elongation factor P--(R)-beta-lysine ligase [Aquificae bacterium]|nr:elongation factor P--(R)-beta-lysine ligase [Aquificota bacterium]
MKPCLIEEVKSKVIQSIREYFLDTGGLEVYTPYLSLYPNLDPNIYPLTVSVEKEGKQIQAYLHTSPEYQMKKLLSKLKRDIFQICNVFRNREGSKKHTVEFMMLEWYRVGYSLQGLMEDTKRLFLHIAKQVLGKETVVYNGREYNLTDWESLTVEEAFLKYAGVSPTDKKGLYNLLKNSNLSIPSLSVDDYEGNFFLVYSLLVEPNLGKEKPTFIHSYPPQFSALAEVKEGKGQRFEAYIGGLELVNGYKELTDKKALKERLEREKAEKEREGYNHPIDWEFIEAVGDMPPSAGASLGIERLLMAFFNLKNIQQTRCLQWI